MKRYKKIAIGLAAFLVVIILFGFFALPPILKSVLVSKLSQNLNRPVSIGQIKINPLVLTLRINDFVVKEPASGGRFVAFKELFMDFEAISPFKRALFFREIRLSGPYIHVSRDAEGKYNFSDLMAKAASGTDTGKKSAPVRYSLGNISIKDGSIDFDDGPVNVRHQVREMNIGIPFVSNTPHYVEAFVQPAFSATINGEPYAVKGRVKPFAESRESNVEISMKGIDVTRYLPYVPVKTNFRVLPALVDVGATVSFIQYKEKGPSLVVSGNVGVTKVAIDDLAGNQLLRLPSLQIAIVSLEPFARKLHLQKVAVEAPSVAVRRQKNGSLNVDNLMQGGKEPAMAGEGKVKAAQASSASAPFIMTADTIELNSGTVLFEDLTFKRPVSLHLSEMNVKITDFSTDRNAKSVVEAGMVYEKKGRIAIKGTLGVEPLTSDLSVDVKGLAIGTVQPYFAKKVKMTVTNGDVALNGRVRVAASDRQGLGLQYSGKVLVSRFSSVDSHNADDLVKFKALSLNAVNVGYNPLSVRIGGVSLADFYARIIVNPDGGLNLQNLTAEDTGEQPQKPTPAARKTTDQGTKTQAATKEKAAGPNVEIGTITLQGGTIDFIDRRIRPTYTANLTELGGRISGLSMRQNARADVEVRGRLDRSVPLEMVGKINPSKENLFVDLAVKFRDLDLAPMTPYSGTYAGYTIQKGKLSIDLKYLIDKRKLESTNAIFFDQFTFGDHVESPSATKLPVRLAVALLKDRHGQIKLTVPVSGSIDDPKFSVWRIVLQVVVNLIAKAATSPFALLGSLFGGGEELAYVEFPYGSARIDDQNVKKMNTLVTALYDRPALKLEIEGHTDIEKDKEALKNDQFMRKLKARKLQEMVKKGQAGISVDDVTIEKQEYEKYLGQAYKAEKFAKPKTMIGLTKSLPAAEMEKLMLTHTVVEEQDLRTLAGRRAQAVKDQLLKSGKVTAERIFVVEPKSLMPEKKQSLKDSRADFRLK